NYAVFLLSSNLCIALDSRYIGMSVFVGPLRVQNYCWELSCGVKTNRIPSSLPAGCTFMRTATLFADTIGREAECTLRSRTGRNLYMELTGESVSKADHSIRYGVVPPETAKKVSGLELLRAIMEGTLPAPPIQQTLDFRLVEVERGHTVFAGIPKF